jgi:hypothetical protein
MGLKIFFAEEGSDPPAFEYNPRNGHLDVSVPGQSRPYRFQYPTGFDEITVWPLHKSRVYFCLHWLGHK